MKTWVRLVVFLSLVASCLSQYGIPDDDDDNLPSRALAEEIQLPAVVSTMSSTSAPAKSYTRYEDEAPVVMQAPIFAFRGKQKAPIYPETDTLQAVGIRGEPTHVEFREDKIQSDYQPFLFAVKTNEQPITSIHSTDLESIRSPTPTITTQIRFSDNYQQNDYSEVRSDVVPIVKYVMDSDHRGTFRLETLTGDGQSKTENGQLKNLGGNEGPVVVKFGSYSYTGDDGKVYQVDWKADEDGFQAFGDHLPTPPKP